MEGHLVVIIHFAVLFVGHFQRGLGDVVNLRDMERLCQEIGADKTGNVRWLLLILQAKSLPIW